MTSITCVARINVAHKFGIGGEISGQVCLAGAAQTLDHAADRREIELPERHGHRPEDVIIAVLGAIERLLKPLFVGDVGPSLDNLFRRGQNAFQPYGLDDAVGGAPFDVALPRPAVPKTLLDQGRRLPSGLEQLVNGSSQRLRLAPAIDLRRRRIPPRDAPGTVTQHDAVLNKVKNVGAHRLGMHSLARRKPLAARTVRIMAEKTAKPHWPAASPRAELPYRRASSEHKWRRLPSPQREGGVRFGQ